MEPVEISRDEWNYLKDDGTYLLDEHVYDCYNFYEGFGIVIYNYKTRNFVNSEGKLLLKTNVYNCWSFNEDGFALICINKNSYSSCFYYIDKECNFYNYKNKVSFKKLYKEYPNMRSELIEIISIYTYFNVEEYFI